MATPQKTPAGTWRIPVFVKGVRDTGTFPTRREAVEWAAKRITELKAAAARGKTAAKLMGEARTLDEAMRKYAQEISPSKRGARWEIIRIEAITTTHPGWPGKRLMSDLDALDFTGWRDARKRRGVKDSTILREMALVSNVLDVARRDWGWITFNPVEDVRKPQAPDHRERVISGLEVRKMLRVLGWGRNKNVKTTKHAVARCFIAALQTGMRAGELVGLKWSDVKENYCILHAGQTKSGKGRQVPLTATARRNMLSMRGWDDEYVFGVTSESLDALFRRHRERAGVEGFTFHDSRHTAATHLAQRLHVLDLCKMFGWKKPDRAMTYYNPTGADIAARLEAFSSPSRVSPK